MKERNSQKQSDSMRSRVRTSILLLLLALVAVTATTVAWFSIADRARVRTMSLDIISGVDLRMDLDAHDTIEAYKKTIAADPNYAEAYSNLALSYCQQALEFGEKATSDLNDPKYQEEQAKIKQFYENAKPYCEKARQLKPDNKELWLNGLYTIYYKLNMGKEFEEIEKLMNNN